LYARKVVLIVNYVVMRGPTRTEQTGMRLEIKVKFNRIRDVRVDNSPSWAVSTSVCLLLGEESDMVTLAHHDHSDLRVNL
jgi:hypothetical protein